MSKALRLIAAAIFGCVAQTTLSEYIRIGGVAPDLMIAVLVAITTYCGSYGGFCTGSVMSMFYDASVGYVLALNMVGYTFIGWAAPLLRNVFGRLFRRLKHKSALEMALVCFLLTILREVLYIGYLFLIGGEQNLMTLIRMLLCAAYSAVAVIPVSYVIKRIMTWHPFKRRKKRDEFADESTTTTR